MKAIQSFKSVTTDHFKCHDIQENFFFFFGVLVVFKTFELQVVQSLNIIMFSLFFPASHLFRQVVQGLLYLHSHNILHRDISLANLLLTKDMRVVSITYFYFYIKHV